MGQNSQKWLTLFLLNAASATSFLAVILLVKLRLCREPDPWSGGAQDFAPKQANSD